VEAERLTLRGKPIRRSTAMTAHSRARDIVYPMVRSTVRYLAIEIDDAIEIAEKIDI
jgi:hypothetical protein